MLRDASGDLLVGARLAVAVLVELACLRVGAQRLAAGPPDRRRQQGRECGRAVVTDVEPDVPVARRLRQPVGGRGGVDPGDSPSDG